MLLQRAGPRKHLFSLWFSLRGKEKTAGIPCWHLVPGRGENLDLL